MKLKINWRELGCQLWVAVKPVLLAAIGGGVVSLSSGCSTMTPATRGQTVSVCALGIPGIAFITQSSLGATHAGGDTNVVNQANPVDVDVPLNVSW